MTRWLKLAIGAGAIVSALSTSAMAQDSTTPPPSNPPPATYSNYGGGGGHGKFGVGGILYMGGTNGLSLAYDTGPWHIDTLIAYSGRNDTDIFNIGGRFWYHVKSSANADLSLGGGGSLRHTSFPGPGNASSDEVFIEAGLQIRVFLAPTVALSVASGLVVGAADADGLGIGNEFNTVGLSGSAALHYYF
jgi:hypothetical protein